MVASVSAWFQAQARDLPWRLEECSPWGVLVSEVMLQQTPVVRVEPVWREWMLRWPTPAALAAAAQADAVRAWGRLGYPRRAQRLWECARAIVSRHEGEVPRAHEDLLALPGVGDYTASAVRAFAFGERAVVLDTNIRRVIGRAWHASALPAAHLTRPEREFAAGLVPADAPAAAAWNAGSMELGALVCTARVARCEECPLSSECAWLAAGKPGLDEAPRRTQAWHGTDRQVRGRILAVLREASAPVNVTGLAVLEDVEPGQLDRCIGSLVEDRLIALVDKRKGAYTLG
ncbi:A/G-specific adenine glycosylase [Demequina aurantiaca]|uniref:A/G-specific adenine glycosylase n=1 Tax=Demequina aurantiaca TaxID=676200 RepID=UPI003D332063